MALAKKAWTKASKFAVGAVAGYEVHDLFEGTNQNQNIPNESSRPLPKPEPKEDDAIGANEIMLILLCLIVILLLIILLIIGGSKLTKFISKRAVKRYQNQNE